MHIDPQELSLKTMRHRLVFSEIAHAMNIISNFAAFLQMSALMLYPEMRKISAQEEEEEVDAADDSAGALGDFLRKQSSEKKLMTQIPLTILPCSSAVSLCAPPPLNHHNSRVGLHPPLSPPPVTHTNPYSMQLELYAYFTAALQGALVMFASFTLRLVSGILAPFSVLR